PADVEKRSCKQREPAYHVKRKHEKDLKRDKRKQQQARKCCHDSCHCTGKNESTPGECERSPWLQPVIRRFHGFASRSKSRTPSYGLWRVDSPGAIFVARHVAVNLPMRPPVVPDSLRAIY